MNKEHTHYNVSVIFILMESNYIHKYRLSRLCLNCTSAQCSLSLDKTITTPDRSTTSRWLLSYSRRLNRTRSWSLCRILHLIRSVRTIPNTVLYRLTLETNTQFPLALARVTPLTIVRGLNPSWSYWCLNPLGPSKPISFLQALNRTRGTQKPFKFTLTFLSVSPLALELYVLRYFHLVNQGYNTRSLWGAIRTHRLYNI